MKKASAVAVMLVVVAMTMVFMAEPGQAITCAQVDIALRPCLDYLKGTTGQPPVECCNGVASIKQNTPTKADRQAACQCVKRAAESLAGLSDDAAKNLAVRCNVQISVPISRNVNCNNVD